YTIKQPTKKVWIIENGTVVATSGQVGLGQRFTDIVTRLVTNGRCKGKNPLDVGREIAAEGRKDFSNTMVQLGQCGALVGIQAKNGFCLFEFAQHDLQPELKTPQNWFVSMGSGQQILDPFLGLIRKAFFLTCSQIWGKEFSLLFGHFRM
ncbi:MAG TPA: hypothetical protein VFU09_03825, partial [Candidatus Udaeobacter sp.]|nr:hypothetical protein [Candidatus Udaeobacter sp.]